MSNGSRLSRKAKLSLVCLQIRPPALMMQKTCPAMPAHKPFEEYGRRKKWNKKDLKKDGCRKRVCLQVDVVFHRWEMRRMMGYFHVAVMCVCVCVAVFHFYFHFKEEWAFNMQLRNCLSVKHSLMSCCFCSLWERAWVSLSTSNESHVERWLDL